MAQLSRRELMGSAMAMAAVEPDLPIIDPHHHLWDFPATATQAARRYVVEDFLRDAAAGHNLVSSVFVECSTKYRTDGPAELRSLGETEFVTALAVENRSPVRVAEAIVAHVDLDIGDQSHRVLEAHVEKSARRLRGIRDASAWDEYPVMGRDLPVRRRELLINPEFRKGFAALKPLGLLFEAWVFHPQIPQVTDLARAFSDTPIILDHLGTPLGVGPYAPRKTEVFAVWKKSIADLARHPNVKIKLGGLGSAFIGLPQFGRKPEASADELANAWRPYIETCIEAFGVGRCMFESNFPPDNGTCSYATLWNAFKIVAAAYSRDEKALLFSGVAAATYGLKV
jgi:L-fuconolactonase